VPLFVIVLVLVRTLYFFRIVVDREFVMCVVKQEIVNTELKCLKTYTVL